MDSNLQNKLQAFTANPPAGVWSKIADALDAEESFSQRLYQYEEEPPVAAWQAIEKGLAEEEAPANVVPFATRFRTPLRYAAVACFIAVVLVTLTLTLKRTEAGAIAPGSKTTVPETAASKQKDLYPQALTETDTETKAAAKQSTVTEKVNNQAIVRNDAKFSSMGEYVFFSDGDGKLRKVAKKLESLVRCKDGDASCQQRLQELRQRMAANAMTTDFTGILEMLHQLQQKP